MKAVSNIRFKRYESHASGMSHARGFQCKRCAMYCKLYECMLCKQYKSCKRCLVFNASGVKHAGGM